MHSIWMKRRKMRRVMRTLIFSGWCGWNEWWCYSQRIRALEETALMRIMSSVLEMLRFEVLFFFFPFEIFN